MTRTLTEELSERYAESRRSMGIQKIRTFLQIRDDEMMMIFYIEADDPQEAVRRMSQERSGINYYLNDIYDRYVDEDPRTKAASPDRLHLLLGHLASTCIFVLGQLLAMMKRPPAGGPAGVPGSATS